MATQTTSSQESIDNSANPESGSGEPGWKIMAKIGLFVAIPLLVIYGAKSLLP